MAQPLMRLFMHEDRPSAAGIILLGITTYLIQLNGARIRFDNTNTLPFPSGMRRPRRVIRTTRTMLHTVHPNVANTPAK